MKSYAVPSLDVVFVENKEYTNWYGIYKVLKIDEKSKTMEVEYLQSFRPEVSVGEKKIYKILSQAGTIAKARRDKEIQSKLDRIAVFEGPDDYFTLGFIAANGHITAEIGPSCHISFPQRYKRITGDDANNHLGSGFGLSPNVDRWSYTLRVHLPQIEPKIAERIKVPNYRLGREGELEINNNEFVWGLFTNGFVIGRNNNRTQQIMEKIPADEKNAFMAGFSANKEIINVA